MAPKTSRPCCMPRVGYDSLIAELDVNPALLDMAVNPLLLTMIANVHLYRGELPRRRAGLYGEVCEVFLGKRHQARGVPIDMTAEQKQTILQSLAYGMMSNGVRDIDLVKATGFITPTLGRIAPNTSAKIFLRRAEESSGLLLERENGLYAFAHFTLQEYLAACYIKEHGLSHLLVENLDQSWWRETILLYAAQADATRIVSECLGRGDADLGLLALAIDCVEEGREVESSERELLQQKLQFDRSPLRFGSETDLRLSSSSQSSAIVPTCG